MANVPLECLKHALLPRDVVSERVCMEIEFFVKDNPIYSDCWMGKMAAKEGDERLHEIYWFGLVLDGSQAYDYRSLEAALNAKIFAGESMLDLWDSIEFIWLNGLSPEYFTNLYQEKLANARQTDL